MAWPPFPPRARRGRAISPNSSRPRSSPKRRAHSLRPRRRLDAAPETSAALALLGHHLDGAARALRDADAAALAIVVVELEPVPRAELDDRVVGADAVAVVALEAVAAAQ